MSAGSLSGTFGTTTSSGTSNLGTLTPSLAYSGTAVDLALSAAGATTPVTPVVVAPTGTSIYTALGTTAILGA